MTSITVNGIRVFPLFHFWTIFWDDLKPVQIAELEKQKWKKGMFRMVSPTGWKPEDGIKFEQQS